MTQGLQPRPWHCPDALVDDWVSVLQNGGDLRMLKLVKILRSIVVNAGIGLITLYALWLGAEPTWVALFGLATLGLYNGIEIADYRALARAVLEVSQESELDDDE
jgi:hypothetical protein